jgi:23S rRNA (adenine2503-C2)-methyltransferase
VQSLASFSLESLAQWIAARNYPPSHARTILRSYYDRAGRFEFDDAPIGRNLQAEMKGCIVPMRSDIAASHSSADGTIKLLIRFPARDGDSAIATPSACEAVLMPAYRDDRAAGCISSQIGCAMGCDFCATAKVGLVRNLTSDEIVEQFLHLKFHAAQQNRRLASLVLMGQGEPLLNLDEVLPALRRIIGPHLGELGGKQVTVSTVGVVPGIAKLAEADLNVHLAVSLHGADDATRGKIVPANRRWPVAEVIEATRQFEASTGRIPTIEYCLLAGVNDSLEQSSKLAELLRGMRVHVNLIPYNPIGAGPYRRTSDDVASAFMDRLRAGGVIAHFRRTRGDDISAACGQLAGVQSQPIAISVNVQRPESMATALPSVYR